MIAANDRDITDLVEEKDSEIRDARTEVEKRTAELEATQEELSARQAYIVMRDAVQGMTREELSQGGEEYSEDEIRQMSEQKEMQLRKLMEISQELGHRIDLQVRANHNLTSLVEKSELRMKEQRHRMLRQEGSLRELQSLVREQAMGIEEFTVRNDAEGSGSADDIKRHLTTQLPIPVVPPLRHAPPPLPPRYIVAESPGVEFMGFTIPPGTHAHIRSNLVCNIL